MTPGDSISGAERLFGELGRVPPPSAAVLDSARERLWSAVAQEMLGLPAGEQPQRSAAPPAHLREESDPGQAGRTRPASGPGEPGQTRHGLAP